VLLLQVVPSDDVITLAPTTQKSASDADQQQFPIAALALAGSVEVLQLVPFVEVAYVDPCSVARNIHKLGDQVTEFQVPVGIVPAVQFTPSGDTATTFVPTAQNMANPGDQQMPRHRADDGITDVTVQFAPSVDVATFWLPAPLGPDGLQNIASVGDQHIAL
jgi:hypothetical protein